MIVEVSLLSLMLALSCRGCLDMALWMFACLDSKHNSTMVFDPSYLDTDTDEFKECDWKEMCGDAVEPKPSKAPPVRGKPTDLQLHVDSDYATEQLTR